MSVIPARDVPWRSVGPLITSDGYECLIVPKDSRTLTCRAGFWVREPGDAWRLHRHA